MQDKITTFAKAFTKTREGVTIEVELKEESEWYLVTFRKGLRQTSISVLGTSDEEWGKLSKLLNSL